MPNGSVTQRTNLPPNWWKRSLYNFIADMPLKGWIWEFMRRGRLLEALEGEPVDAMNPDPETENLDGDYIRFYNNYSQVKIDERIFLPRSVNQVGTWPIGFQGQQYKVDAPELRDLKTITIDLNRRDRVITADFQALLSTMRKSHRKPKRVNPRTNDWIGNCILQVWDLRQYQCSYTYILQRLDGLNDISSVRNAINTSNRYIQKAGWIKLARQVEQG